MNVILRNHTEYDIILGRAGTFFVAGKYKKEPKLPVKPKEFTEFEFEDSNIGGGVNAGNAWVVSMDDCRTWHFATGYFAPVFPAPDAAGVVESSSAEDGNKAATPDGNEIASKETFGDIKHQFKFVAEAKPQEDGPTVITVSTVPVN